MNEQLVIVRDGKALADSRTVAKIFEKEHKHVLESIDKILSQLPDNFGQPNFRPTEYVWTNNLGKEVHDKMYLLTRDAFTLLAMGFTGPKALKFKLEYIKAFNDMETALKNGDQTLHKAVEDGKASDHPVFDHVINETFDRVLTVEDFPCLIEIRGRKYIPVSVISSAVRFRNLDDCFYIGSFCKNRFNANQYIRRRLPRYAVLVYNHFPHSHRRLQSCYSYSLLSEECIPELVTVLNEHSAYLGTPIGIRERHRDLNLEDILSAAGSASPADIPIGELLKLPGLELLKIFLKGLTVK